MLYRETFRYWRDVGSAVLPSFLKNHLSPLIPDLSMSAEELGRTFAANFDIDRDQFLEHIKDGESYYDRIETKIKDELGQTYYENYTSGPGIMPRKELSLLYALVRVTEPEMVVETGVAQGSSTAMILQAMSKNDRGNLHSIDLPRFADRSKYTYKDGDFPIESFDAAVIPKGKEPGWLVDETNADRWTLQTGRSTEYLREVVVQEPVDIFIHDSEHSYRNILWELAVVAPEISPGGWIWVDDADWNDAFQDFANGVMWTDFMIGRAGILHVDDDFTKSTETTEQ